MRRWLAKDYEEQKGISKQVRIEYRANRGGAVILKEREVNKEGNKRNILQDFENAKEKIENKEDQK